MCLLTEQQIWIEKINTITCEIAHKENSTLNLSNFLKYAIDITYNPLKLWDNSDLGNKQRFQNLLFPNGILFDKENKYIEPLAVNQFFTTNINISIDCGRNKKDFSAKNTKKSAKVESTGLEPVTSTLPVLRSTR